MVAETSVQIQNLYSGTNSSPAVLKVVKNSGGTLMSSARGGCACTESWEHQIMQA